jgi:hypothetical protein
MIKWYLPTFYGDIRLESQAKERTMVTLHGLTPEERVAMEKLLTRAAESGITKSRWATDQEINAIDLRRTSGEQKILLQASITSVHKVLAKALKPERKKLSVVKFSGGKIEEVTEATQGLIEMASESETTTTSGSKETAKAIAATVAAPILGCPAPDFPHADVLATEVLRAFLTPEQVSDFNTYGAFVALGVDSGHRYQLTSRHCRPQLALVNRVLYDLDEQRELCVHDWDVPASEELLAIFLHLQTPGREAYLETLPD